MDPPSGPVKLSQSCFLDGSAHNRRMLLRPAAFTLLLSTAALANAPAPPPAPAPAPVTPPPSVAEEGYLVVPFANASNVKGLDWMASALPTAIGEKLEAHPFLRPVYGGAILDGFPLKFDEAHVAARARDAGARWVIGG